MTDRNRPRRAVVLVAAAIAFFLAAATFGTLWVLERTEHGTTSSRLADIRAEIGTVSAKLAEAEAQRKVNTGELEQAGYKAGYARALRNKFKECADAGRTMVQAANARDEKKYLEATGFIGRHCR